MLDRLFIILALLTFLFLIVVGAPLDSAVFKSSTVFLALLFGSRIATYLIGVIKDSKHQEKGKSHSHG